MYRLLFILIALLAVAIGLLLGTLNADPVTVDLLWVQLEWPLGLVLVSSLALGVVLGVCATWVLQVWPARMAARRARRDAEAASITPPSPAPATPDD
jgi:uncharacterized integral membrane protein